MILSCKLNIFIPETIPVITAVFPCTKKPQKIYLMKQYYLIRQRACSLFFLFTTLFTFQAKATDLNAGELLFTGYHANASTTDAFSFVLLVNLSGTTIINFTDNGWLSTNVFRAGEQTVTWTYTGTLVAGREITISGPSAGAGIAILSGSGTTIGSCSGTIPSLATSGDQIIAYRGTVGAPTLIAGLHMNVYSTDLGQCANTTNAAWDPTCIVDNANFSVMPLGLAAGVSTTWIGTEGVSASEQDNARFNCTGPLLTAAQVRAAVTNSANWTANSVAPPNFTLPSGCAYLGLIGLPLNLVSFNGNNNGNDISLLWQTTNEYNHDHFVLEKSLDGRNFIPLTRINAQGGFSYLPFNYNYRDAAPVKGANFYRLKMVAANGSVQYSEIVKIMFGNDGRSLLISPNPAAGKITVSSAGNIYTQVTISSMAGQVVLQEKLLTNNQQVNISRLAPGQYSITVSGPGERVTERLMIVQ